MNRLTITLDDDLYAMARAHAVAMKTSISKAIGDLMRRNTSQGGNSHSPEPAKEFHIDPVTLLPVVPGHGHPITMEDIQRSIDDEDVRHLEIMGLTPEEIERSLGR